MPDNPERFPSARDIEKVARNPECQTLRMALGANLDLRKYAHEVVGLAEERQSPIALARGNQVDRFVLGNDAQILVDKLLEDGKMASPPEVQDLGRRPPNRPGMAKAAAKTDEYIAARLAGKPAPAVLVHPVLSIALGSDTQFIEPDALIAYPETLVYEPLELKSYPFRYGKTDPENLRQARRQGAVYVQALRKRAEFLGAEDSIIRSQVTLVFTAPDSLYPRPIYHESVDGEMRDVQQAISLLEASKAELKLLMPDGGDVRDLLPTLDIHYMERCLSFCSLAKHCREACSSEGKVSILGERPGRVLSPATNVERAIELLHGAEPIDDGEATMAQRLRELADALGTFEVAK